MQAVIQGFFIVEKVKVEDVFQTYSYFYVNEAFMKKYRHCRMTRSFIQYIPWQQQFRLIRRIFPNSLYLHQSSFLRFLTITAPAAADTTAPAAARYAAVLLPSPVLAALTTLASDHFVFAGLAFSTFPET